eukprot:m.54983 g.54983  ORF g.54983 m.54983 type:complete len:119 (+) comp13649_c0_seq15:55-411(+)
MRDVCCLAKQIVIALALLSVVTRGLFEVELRDQTGTTISTYYFAEDDNGDIRDPYCGSSDAISVFATYLPIFALQANTTLPDGICCGDNEVFERDRSADTNDWCQRVRLESWNSVSLP